MKKTETLKPIVLTNTDTNETFTLEFTRDTVKFAESRGFIADNIDKFPNTLVPDLFYFAFRAHHKRMTHEMTDKILFEDLGGMPEGMLTRLVELYYAPLEALTQSDEDKARKNAKMTVDF